MAEHDKTQGGVNENAAEHQQCQSVQVTGALEIVQRTPEAPPGATQQQKPQKPWYSRPKVWNLILAAAGVAVAAWLVYQTYDIAIADQRAWVLFKPGSLASSDQAFSYVLHNYGKGPAFDINVAAPMFVKGCTEQNAIESDFPAWSPGRPVLPPGEDLPGQTVEFPTPANQYYDQWLNGANEVWSRIVVGYKDQFRKYRETGLCFRIAVQDHTVGKGGVTLHNAFNYAK